MSWPYVREGCIQPNIEFKGTLQQENPDPKTPKALNPKANMEPFKDPEPS